MPSQCADQAAGPGLKTFNLGLVGPVWLETFRYLREHHRIEPVYWTGLAADQAYLVRHFPGVIVHNVLDAIRGIEPAGLPAFPRMTLDAEILDAHARHQLVAMNMMQRMDPGRSFFYEERVRLYGNLLQYWWSVLKHYRPDVVVFPVTPHAIYDYVAYVLCKDLGIDTIIFGVNSLSRFYIYRDFTEGHTAAKRGYAQGLKTGVPRFELSPRAAAHFKHITEQADANYLLTYRRYRRRAGTLDGGRTLRGWALAVKNAIPSPAGMYRFITDPAPRNYLKQRGRTIEDSRISGLGWRLNKRRGHLRKRALARLYRSLCSEVDVSGDYIYVPLHYQPENTTCPNGGVFDDQLLMVRMLSALLPSGWKLLVKDYPNIFDFKLNGERARSRTFYRDLARIDHVRLVPLDYDSFDLIDHCRAVATVTGSAGWESVCRGKPALAFGHAWYDGCEGVFHVPSVERCRRALESIRDGYRPDIETVKYFLHVFDQHCIDACPDGIFQEDHALGPEENVRALAEALLHACDPGNKSFEMNRSMA